MRLHVATDSSIAACFGVAVVAAAAAEHVVAAEPGVVGEPAGVYVPLSGMPSLGIPDWPQKRHGAGGDGGDECGFERLRYPLALGSDRGAGLLAGEPERERGGRPHLSVRGEGSAGRRCEAVLR